jgi:hypothetical protein
MAWYEKYCLIFDDTDRIDFLHAANYQGSIIALQLFLQHFIVENSTVTYKNLLEYYFERSRTVSEFLALRSVRFWHEDDERDGSERDFPLTCSKAQDVFENIELLLFKRMKPKVLLDHNSMANLNARTMFETPEFKRIVDDALAKIKKSYDETALEVGLKMFFKDTVGLLPVAFKREAGKCIVRASVFSTSDYYQYMSDEENEDHDKFMIEMNDIFEITNVSFESFDWVTPERVEDLESFIESAIVLKTESDSRLETLYGYSREFIQKTMDIFKYLHEEQLTSHETGSLPHHTTRP